MWRFCFACSALHIGKLPAHVTHMQRKPCQKRTNLAPVLPVAEDNIENCNSLLYGIKVRIRHAPNKHSEICPRKSVLFSNFKSFLPSSTDKSVSSSWRVQSGDPRADQQTKNAWLRSQCPKMGFHAGVSKPALLGVSAACNPIRTTTSCQPGLSSSPKDGSSV